ncbi:MAG: response regulator [bacterium]
MEEPLILIVEDSKVHQRLLTEAFRQSGYTDRFDIQGDAAGAWASVDAMLRSPRSLWPRFAVVDIGLPGMSGIDLVDRIRHEGNLARWPIIILTASTDPDDRAESMMADATAFFSKPSAPGGYRQLAVDILDFLGADIGWLGKPPHASPEHGTPAKRPMRR